MGEEEPMEENKNNLLTMAFGAALGAVFALAASKWTKPAANSSSSSPGATPVASSSLSLFFDGVTSSDLEQQLMRLVEDGRESDVNFDEFPYYLSKRTRILLTSAAYIHLKETELSRHTRFLTSASRTILLSGASEFYKQRIAKALAHYFEAKLLVLDVTAFSLEVFKRFTSESTLKKKSSSILPHRDASKESLHRKSSSMSSRPRALNCGCNEPRLHKEASVLGGVSSNSAIVDPVPPKKASICPLEVLIQSLYKVLDSVSKSNPIILYIRHIDNILKRSDGVHSLFENMLRKISGPVLILGSSSWESDNRNGMFTTTFSYNIEIDPPQDDALLVRWDSQLWKDTYTLQLQDNRSTIEVVLAENDVECDDLSFIFLPDAMFIRKYIGEIVLSAISYHLMNNKNPQYRNGRLIISSKSLSHVLSIFQEKRLCGKDTLKLPATTAKSEEKISPDDSFEKNIRSQVIPAGKIAVTFDDIGSLVEIKESLRDLVLLPLQRPELFKGGGLLKPCKGVLLFGPPGTGKTMLAKAIAKEARASFINVSMSTIKSKWFGEADKNVRALFTLAAKVSPAIIFIDEVDSMLGRRSSEREHEAMRSIKNEFMTRWDGLLTEPGEGIVVLAATNRPFDLDEAVIRRFERRIMVGLPSLEGREAILRKLLSKEKVEALDFKELATMTEGYSGSDLKNLCVAAAYRPMRELVQKERSNSGGRSSDVALRALNMEDLRHAKKQVCSSYAADSFVMRELEQWNEQYGEGGSRKRQQLSYFL